MYSSGIMMALQREGEGDDVTTVLSLTRYGEFYGMPIPPAVVHRDGEGALQLALSKEWAE